MALGDLEKETGVGGKTNLFEKRRSIFSAASSATPEELGQLESRPVVSESNQGVLGARLDKGAIVIPLGSRA